MEHLLNYLCEAIRSKRFVNYTSKPNVLFGIKHLYIHDNAELQQFFLDILSENPHLSKTPFIYSQGAKYFKMPYAFTPIIKSAAQGSQFEIQEEGGEKISLRYKGKKIMETGRGSVDRVPTKLQENSTCLLWNICMNVGSEENVSLDKLNDIDYVKNILIDAYGEDAEKLTINWVSSFSKQITTLVKYCESLGINPKEYRMTRYGNRDEVASSYEAMVRAYTKYVGGEGRNMKDTFDPSDVIFYKLTESKKIVGICKAGTDMVSCLAIKEQYKKDLFIPHICMGVSLKQIVSNTGKVDVFNVHSDNLVGTIDKVQKSNSSNNGLTLLCTGEFNFNDFVDENGSLVKNTSEVLLVMRTFGSGRVGIEVKLNTRGCPSLGKCPVDIWRKSLDCTKDMDLESCSQKLLNAIESPDIIASLIKYAIKEGPHCFPFILLH